MEKGFQHESARGGQLWILRRARAAPGGPLRHARARTGVHDPLTARAIVVEDTAVVVLDVIGCTKTWPRGYADAAHTRRPIIVGSNAYPCAPVSMLGGWAICGPEFLRRIEDGDVEAVPAGCGKPRPATIAAVWGATPAWLGNRRQC